MTATPPENIDCMEYTSHVPENIPTAVQQATQRFLGNRAQRLAEFPEWESYRQLESSSTITMRGRKAAGCIVLKGIARVSSPGKVSVATTIKTLPTPASAFKGHRHGLTSCAFLDTLESQWYHQPRC